MSFDAIIKELRAGADTRLTRARECRAAATHHQTKALAATVKAADHEEFARGLDLLADALASGALTVEHLREIVAAANTGEAPARGFEVDDVVNVCQANDRHWGARGIVTAVWTSKGVVADVTVRFSEDLTLTLPASWLMHTAAFVAQMDAAEQQAAKDAEAAEDVYTAEERADDDAWAEAATDYAATPEGIEADR